MKVPHSRGRSPNTVSAEVEIAVLVGIARHPSRSTYCTRRFDVTRRFHPLLLVLCAIAIPASTSAQETRSGVISAEQADKATRLRPYEPHWSENLLLSVRRSMIEEPSGFYPYFGSVYSGGGFTLGAGYRYFVGDRTHWNVAGLYSAKNAKLIEGGLNSPGHYGGRLDLRASALWRDATQVPYHGMGITSPEDLDTGYRMQQALVGGSVTGRPHRWVPLTAAVSYEDFTLKDPTGSTLTPVEDTFTPATAPGLGVNPAYVHTMLSAALDWRPAADYARRGGLYRVERHFYADRDSTYSFDRLEAEVVQHVPILRENWVVSMRARLDTVLDDADQVPYFLLPSLGSGSSLRGYGSWRFRDRHAMLLSGEWRWIPNRLVLDMALFYDTGMVAPQLESIAWNEFRNNVGVGVRFHTPIKTALRVEVAHGDEGLHLIFAASSAF
jgi:hypothetical protein